MDISNVAFRLIIILLPGIISTLLFKNLTLTTKWDSFKFSTYTLLLSGITYIILQILKLPISLFNSEYSTQLKVWGSLTEDILPLGEVLIACIISIFIGLIAAYIGNKKLIFKWAERLKISNKYGNESLFFKFMEGDDVYEVYLKDIKNSLVYHGYIEYFAESDTIREIVLTNVDIYNIDKLDEIKSTRSKVFLSQNLSEHWLIELPNFKTKEDEK